VCSHSGTRPPSAQDRGLPSPPHTTNPKTKAYGPPTTKTSSSKSRPPGRVRDSKRSPMDEPPQNWPSSRWRQGSFHLEETRATRREPGPGYAPALDAKTSGLTAPVRPHCRHLCHCLPHSLVSGVFGSLRRQPIPAFGFPHALTALHRGIRLLDGGDVCAVVAPTPCSSAAKAGDGFRG